MKQTIKYFQCGLSAFLLLMSIGAFTYGAFSGICCLISATIICPYIRIPIVDFIFKLSAPKKHFPFVNQEKREVEHRRKINTITYTLAVILFFFSMLSVPESTSETLNTDTAAVATIESSENVSGQTQHDSNESDALVSVETQSEETEDSHTQDFTIEPATVVSKPEPTEAVEQTEVLKEETISNMEVHFIDVGQGDATLIKTETHSMLIDTGDNSKGTAVQLYLQKQGIEKLDYLILTHTDSDHIGGADVIITKFDIDTVFIGDFKKDNKTYNEVMDALSYKNLKYSVPKVGSAHKLGNATFEIVAPNDTYSDPNNSSIALVVRNGNNSFLFTGDCEEDAEEDILKNGLDIDCDVYKLGHHGSKTASSKAFLDKATPVYGVISCAEGNAYGHPHAEPLNNLRAMDVKIFRTDEQGSVVAYSDGENITWNCSPSESWQVGEAAEVSTSEQKSEPIPEKTSEPEKETTQDTENSSPVWISATGSKYHSINNCGNMNPNKARQMSESDAIAKNYGKCKKCW